jgi:DNA-binding GntR family transcriptional regulator
VDVHARNTAGETAQGPARRPRDVAMAPPAHRTGMRMASVAYQQIKEQLLEGHWKAGERLSLEIFKTALGVSKQPIMEALRRLDADGLVEIIPQVGCRVASYDSHDVADYFTLFGAFEGAIAGVAATRRTDADLTVLHGVHLQIGDLCGHTDRTTRAHGYRVLNRDFHGVIHRMARSTLVEEMSLRMWDLSDFLINTAGLPQPLSSALDHRHADHQAIYDALVAGDAATARTSMEAHILGTVGIISHELEAADISD